MADKIKDIRVKTEDQLESDIVSLKKEALNLRFQQASGQLKNTSRRRQIRREVARIKTILAERKSAKAAAETAEKKEA